jgi:hypothetical protein
MSYPLPGEAGRDVSLSLHEGVKPRPTGLRGPDLAEHAGEVAAQNEFHVRLAVAAAQKPLGEIEDPPRMIEAGDGVPGADPAAVRGRVDRG